MTTPALTPQQRWQTFKGRLPVLTRWQIVGVGVAVLGFVLLVVPFILPLSGPDVLPLTQLQDPDGRFIELNGQQIYYRHVLEANAGDAVILLHGFGGSSVTWRDVLPLLEGYDVVAVDLPGAGLAEKGLELDLSHAAQADTLAALMDALNIEAAHVVGHDMGGNIGVHFVQRHPQKALTLTLVAPSLITSSPAAMPAWVFEFPVLQRWERHLVRFILPPSTEINLRSAAEQDSVVSDGLAADYERAFHTEDWDLSLLALARDSSRSGLAAPISDLALPVLIVWGEDDSWIAPDNAGRLEADIPNASRVMLAGVGHLPMHEAPSDVAQAWRDFWAANAPDG